MRATKCKHFKTGNEVKNQKKSVKKSPKRVKAISFVSAFVLAVVCFIVPTTTLAPNVDAFEDSRAAAYSVGGLETFASHITDNCIEETTTSKTQETTVTAADTKAEKETTAETTLATEPETVEATEEVIEETTEAVEETTYVVEETEEVFEAEDQSDYLISISKPDPNYSPKAVSLSSYDREKLERLVMGEAGSLGYTGCALVAQSIRDAMNRSGTTSIDAIISEYKYVASTKTKPNNDVKNAVSYIFDENGSAVQHRVLCFYTGTSNWHETQLYITSCGNVRFFDLLTD